MKRYYNIFTKTFIHDFNPIKIFIYPLLNKPIRFINPLAKSLLLKDSTFHNGNYLYRKVLDVQKADFILFPYDLDLYRDNLDEIFYFLKYYEDYKEKHLFFDDRDETDIFPSERSIILKTSLYKDDCAENIICIPYMEMIDDFYYEFLRHHQKKYDFSFIGQKSKFRLELFKKIIDEKFSCDISFSEDYFHKKIFCDLESKDVIYKKKERINQNELRKKFIKNISNSYFALAPRGYGLNSYRFFEALSIGIPPILISDNCALPYENIIDYSQCCKHINIKKDKIFEELHNLEEIKNTLNYKNMCNMSRFIYDTYLKSDKFLHILFMLMEQKKSRICY